MGCHALQDLQLGGGRLRLLLNAFLAVLEQELLGILEHFALLGDFLGQRDAFVAEGALEPDLLLHPLLILLDQLPSRLFPPLLALISHLVVPDQDDHHVFGHIFLITGGMLLLFATPGA